ncbi:MAG: hypothetical protein ACUVRD_03675 [Bacteroidia bacterium]
MHALSKIVRSSPNTLLYLPILLGTLASCQLHNPQAPPVWIGLTLSAEDQPYLDSTCWKNMPPIEGVFLHLRLSYAPIRQVPEVRSSLRLQVLNYLEALPNLPFALIVDAPWDTTGFFPSDTTLAYWIENFRHELESTLFSYLPWERIRYLFVGRDWYTLHTKPHLWNPLFQRWDSLYPHVHWGTVLSFPMPIPPHVEIIGLNYIPHMPSATRQYHTTWDTFPRPLFITHANLYEPDKSLSFHRRLSFWSKPLQGICLNSLDPVPVWCHPNPKIHFNL